MRYGLDENRAIKLREIATKLKTTPIEVNNMVNRVLRKAQKIAAKLGYIDDIEGGEEKR